jgi:hypothetical protein
MSVSKSGSNSGFMIDITNNINVKKAKIQYIVDDDNISDLSLSNINENQSPKPKLSVESHSDNSPRYSEKITPRGTPRTPRGTPRYSKRITPRGAQPSSKTEFPREIRSALTGGNLTPLFEKYPNLVPFFNANTPYAKVTKKMGKTPLGLGITSSGVYLHLKKSCGEGYYKKVSHAEYITSSGKVRVVYKKLKDIVETENAERSIFLRVRVLEELQIQKSFNHSFIVKIHSYYAYGDRKIAIYEEPCDCDLKKAVLNGDIDTYRQKLNVAIDVAGAITYLHKEKHSHNDIKLDNIFLKDGRGKLGDFGLCKPFGSLYGGCIRIGAPEQTPGQRNIGNDKTDVFQFGLCLWNLFHPNPPSKDHMDTDYVYPWRKLTPEAQERGDVEGSSPDAWAEMFDGWDCDTLQNEKMGKLVGDCLHLDPNARPSMEIVRQTLLEIQELPF